MKGKNFIRLLGGCLLFGALCVGCSSKHDVATNDPAMTPSSAQSASMTTPPETKVAQNDTSSANLGAASSGNAR
jgi:hypothetical protein